jgi:hypothetical protein
MIKTICSEREISRNSNTGYAWSLPIFGAIECENLGISTNSSNDSGALLYRNEVVEQKWEGILKLSTSQNWKVAKIPILNKHVR